MPLSEQEQRLLDEMERHLMQNDADVVSAHADRALSYRNLIYGAVLLLAGIGGLIVGVIVGNVGGIIIGVIAFAAMLAGLMLALTPVHRAGGRDAATDPKQSEPTPSFMDRMNDRWDRRHGEH
ncbi:MAG: DUF3040 domain-containing protein [Actinobacteria bacterium]|nr:DUF3040 domain-containing protein [Actinomycetota bacterium]